MTSLFHFPESADVSISHHHAFMCVACLVSVLQMIVSPTVVLPVEPSAYPSLLLSTGCHLGAKLVDSMGGRTHELDVVTGFRIVGFGSSSLLSVNLQS